MTTQEMQIAADAVASAAAECAETAQAVAKAATEYAYLVVQYAAKIAEDARAYAEATQATARDATAYAYFAAKSAERLPTVYPRKGDWVEFGTKVAAKTDAEHAADNARCNAAYLAKKTEGAE